MAVGGAGERTGGGGVREGLSARNEAGGGGAQGEVEGAGRVLFAETRLVEARLMTLSVTREGNTQLRPVTTDMRVILGMNLEPYLPKVCLCEFVPVVCRFR